MGGEWWESFFSGLWLDAQRQARTPEQNNVEADFVEEVLCAEPASKILDVPCGDGRLSLELASHGHMVTGVDMTDALLQDARKRSAERGLDVRWEKRDMRDLPWESEFDGALCYWGSFGYFDDEGDAEFLKAVSRSIKPGGRFLLDLHAAESLLPKFQPRGWQWMGDILMVEDRHYDCATGRVEEEWLMVRGNASEKKTSSIRIYTYREICRMLGAAGFSSMEGYGSMAKEPFALGSRRLYLVAEK